MPDGPLAILRPIATGTEATAQPLTIRPTDDPIVIGRSAEADWQLPDPRVSRRHALIRVVGRAVIIRDLNSRHGTVVNGSRLAPGGETPIREGDSIQFGGLRCMVDHRSRVPSALTIADDASQVSVLERDAVGGLARARLDALIDAAKKLASAETRADAAAAIIDSVTAIPECARASVFRPIGVDDYELLASAGGFETPSPSRSLLRAASRGNLVQLSGEAGVDSQSHSIIQMQVRSAVCAPVRVAGETDCLLYIDTRNNERTIDADAIALCDAVSAVAGLAIERILAEEMADRQRQVELDLRSARDAQRMLFPPSAGSAPGLRYVFESIPGRHVGGDLFDCFELGGGRSAFFLGDAVGKGAGAGVLMVATQTLLRNLLESGRELGEAVTLTNRSLAARSQADKFVTLMAGVCNAEDGSLQVVDAGHGFALLDAGEGFGQIGLAGDIPLGISAETVYRAEALAVTESGRLVICSDGVIEQPDLAGHQFGVEGTIEALKGSTDAAEDVARIVRAVREHAGADFSDDLTVASVAFGEG